MATKYKPTKYESQLDLGQLPNVHDARKRINDACDFLEAQTDHTNWATRGRDVWENSTYREGLRVLRLRVYPKRYWEAVRNLIDPVYGVSVKETSEYLLVKVYYRSNLNLSPHKIRIYWQVLMQDDMPGEPEIDELWDNWQKFRSISDVKVFKAFTAFHHKPWGKIPPGWFTALLDGSDPERLNQWFANGNFKRFLKRHSVTTEVHWI